MLLLQCLPLPTLRRTLLSPSLVVRFIISQGRTEVTVTEALAQAFDQSKEAGLAPVWVQEQEVLNISHTNMVTFIHGDLVSHYFMSG
jgi:hypothetical protein